MNCIKEKLEIELSEIERLINKIEHNKNNKYKDYTSVIKKGNGIYRYFYRDESGELIYIPAAKREFAKDIVQKDYYNKLSDTLCEQKKLITKFLNRYEPNSAISLYEKISDGRKKLINPVIEPENLFIKDWLDKNKGQQNSFPNEFTIKTERGEMVKSKSEKILADLFYRYNIPYQYEPEFVLKNKKKIYPDFVVLNVKERKTYYWEHFGLASNEEYSEKNLEKLYQYELIGMEIGEKLIVSFESNRKPLDIELVKNKLKKYLL